MNTAAETESKTEVVIFAIEQAKHAARRLANAGITVHAIIANGRRPVLLIDRAPAGIAYVAKRQSPNGMGGTAVVYAAQFAGCQLEWMRDFPGAVVEERRHG